MLSRDVRKFFERIKKGEINQKEAAEELARNWDREALGLYIFELYDSLNWYVEHDDTNNISENETWTIGLRHALDNLDKSEIFDSGLVHETWEDCTYCIDGTEPDPESTLTKMCRWCGGCQKLRKSP
jgi:hypothetical protein